MLIIAISEDMKLAKKSKFEIVINLETYFPMDRHEKLPRLFFLKTDNSFKISRLTIV